MEGVDDPDILNIFVATDNHLGFKEQDAIRGNDSFNTMEEIFKYAVDYDMLLLGGDLFHHNKPSRHCMHRTLKLFRKYCLCDKDITFNVTSDPVCCCTACRSMLTLLGYVTPVFVLGRNFQGWPWCELPRSSLCRGTTSIYYSRQSRRSPTRRHVNCTLSFGYFRGTECCCNSPQYHMRTLTRLRWQAANLLNYFGTTDKLDHIEVHPILMEKGRTKVLGFLRFSDLFVFWHHASGDCT